MYIGTIAYIDFEAVVQTIKTNSFVMRLNLKHKIRQSSWYFEPRAANSKGKKHFEIGSHWLFSSSFHYI